MKVTLAAVADHASVSMGDKLNVMGVFDTIYAADFPAIHPRMVLVVRVLMDYEDRERDYTLRVKLEDEDGHVVFDQTARGHVGAVPPGENPAANFIYELAGLRFTGPGRYRFLITTARETVELPLRVVRRAR